MFSSAPPPGAARWVCTLPCSFGQSVCALPCACLGIAPGRMPGGVAPPRDASLLVRAKSEQKRPKGRSPLWHPPLGRPANGRRKAGQARLLSKVQLPRGGRTRYGASANSDCLSALPTCLPVASCKFQGAQGELSRRDKRRPSGGHSLHSGTCPAFGGIPSGNARILSAVPRLP